MRTKKTTEPTWVPRVAVLGAHFDLLQEHGGEHGLRQRGAPLDAALVRPVNKYNYAPGCDLADLAAAYAFAIAKVSHPFNDGNKRTGFAVAAMFLELNGLEVEYPEVDVVKTMLAVAEGSMSEKKLAKWFRSGIRGSRSGER
jgi:death-on-curing protein